MSQQINLLPAAFRANRASYTSAAAMGCAIAGAVVLAVLFGVYEEYRLREVQAEARTVANALKEATAARAAAAGPQTPRKPSPQLEARVAELTAHLSARQEIVDAVKSGVVGTTAGFSEYMRVFSRQSLEGLWLTGFDIAAGGNELALSGRALAAELVPAYLQRLNREASMQGRQFASVVINQAAENDRAPSRVAVKAALPPHVEFQVSSSDAAEARARTPGSPAATRNTPATPALTPPATAAGLKKQPPPEAAK